MAQVSDRIDHDRLFKKLLETFFAEFIELFLPEAARELDFSSCRFLSQEVISDLESGERHVLDLLVEANLRNEPGIILVHVEHQGYVQENFSERMFLYFSGLYQKYRKRIIPVDIFAYDQARAEPDTFDLAFSFLEVLRFRFQKVELRRLPWRRFLRQDNPVAAALFSKMGYKPEERVQVKREFMFMLGRLKLDPARAALAISFFETYLHLTPEEEKELEREIAASDQPEAVQYYEYETSYHRRGRAEAKREDIAKYLQVKFGVVPSEADTRTSAMSLEELDELLSRLFRASTREEAARIQAGEATE